MFAYHAQKSQVLPQYHINKCVWDMSVIPVPERQRQEDQKFKVIFHYVVSLKASLGYMRLSQKTK